MGQRVRFWVGAALCLLGLVMAAQIPWFYLRAHAVGASALRRAEALPSAPSALAANQTVSVSDVSGPSHWAVTTPLAIPQTGDLLGGIRIPALHLRAPLFEGTDDNVLNVGVGHLSTTTMPGQPGVSLLAAHNATWFRHINQLHVGDEIQVWTKQGAWTYRVMGHQIVQVGAQVVNTAAPSLVLESCYPLNALYLTQQRYLVMAALVSSGRAPGSSTPTPTPTPATANPYSANIPADLAKQGLTLSQSDMPMGVLRYTGSPIPSYSDSSKPLSAVNTLVQLFNACLHAASEGKFVALQQLLQKDPLALRHFDPVVGTPLAHIQYVSPFDVTLQVDGDVLRSATAHVSLNCGASTEKLTVSAQVSDRGVMTLDGWAVQP